MRKIITSVLILFIFFFCLNKAFTQKQILDLIINEWRLVSIIDSAGDAYKQTGKDILLISDDNYNNSFALYEGSLYGYGSWSVVDSILILAYNAGPIEAEVDSSVYKIINNEPVLILYSDGDEISRIVKNELILSKNRYLNIVKCTNETLILEDAEYKFVYYSSGEHDVVPEVTETIIKPVAGISVTSIMRGLLGMVVILIVAFLLSHNRKAIAWKSIGIGLLFQILIAVAVLNVPFIELVFEFAGKLYIKAYDFTRSGSEFIFGDLMDTSSYGFIFAFQVLPTIIFFSALSSVLFYYGIIQKIVFGLAWLLKKAMKLSGAESLATAGNIFLGQIEAPLMIKAYLSGVNRSEMMLVMVGGMATIAGSVFAIYMGILGGDDPAGQLLGEKIVLNELIAYKSLKEYIDVTVFAEEKSILMATYLLCGFANFGSVGIQLGGIGGLVPEKRKLISRLGIRAMIGGTIASLLSATIIGMLIG